MNKIQHKNIAHVRIICNFELYCKPRTHSVPCAGPGIWGLYIAVCKRVELLFYCSLLFDCFSNRTFHIFESFILLFINKIIWNQQRISLFYYTVSVPVLFLGILLVCSQKFNQPRDWMCAHFRWGVTRSNGHFSIWLFFRSTAVFP